MEFVLVLFLFPIAIIFSSMIVTGIIKKFYIMPIITFTVFLILTYTIFNESFLFWVVLYTVLSLIVSVLTKLILNKTSKK